MTVDEFLIWASGDNSGRLWQLRDGMPEAMAPTKEAQGAIQGGLGRLLGTYLLQARPQCRVIVDAGVVPRVRAARMRAFLIWPSRAHRPAASG